LNSDLISGEIYLDLTRPLPLPDECFTYVFGEHVIEHIPEGVAVALLGELHRVLRPGGVLAASTWRTDVDDLTRTWRALVEEAIGAEMLRSALEEATPWAERFGDPVRLEETLRGSGLHPVRVERRSYRFTMTRDDYIAEQSTRALGRFVQDMLGESGWNAFLERARTTYASSFGQNVEDSRDVLIAVGTKP
jgi:2-polyprenyl-3-methyl-5-hydroxy-6-metoxy-1,4-benzoquinol methylase